MISSNVQELLFLARSFEGLSESNLDELCCNIINEILDLSPEDRQKYFAYYKEETKEITKQSFWNQILQIFKKNKQSNNSGNLLILWLLGLTELNPMDYYVVLGERPGKDLCWQFDLVNNTTHETISRILSNEQYVYCNNKLLHPSEIKKGEVIVYQNVNYTVIENKKIFAKLIKIKASPEQPYVMEPFVLIPDRLDHQWYVSNDVPDIDIDFNPWARDILKDWTAEQFGQDKVVSICNYTTFKVKSAISDVLRVYEVPFVEVKQFTKSLPDDVDDMSWDAAVEKYPILKNYVVKYPEAMSIAQKLVGRKRALGKHASGVSICNIPISDIIPLVTAKRQKSEDRVLLSSFSEGLNRSDLKTFGLVKFDYLGLSTLDDIDKALKIIKERYVKVGTEKGTAFILKNKKLNVLRDNQNLTVEACNLLPGDEILE